MKKAPALSLRNAHHTVTVWAEAVSGETVIPRAGMSTAQTGRATGLIECQTANWWKSIVSRGFLFE